MSAVIARRGLATIAGLAVLLSATAAHSAQFAPPSPAAVAEAVSAHLAGVPQGSSDVNALLLSVQTTVMAPAAGRDEAYAGVALAKALSGPAEFAAFKEYLSSAKTAQRPGLGKEVSDALAAWSAKVRENPFARQGLALAQKEYVRRLAEISPLDVQSVQSLFDGTPRVKTAGEESPVFAGDPKAARGPELKPSRPSQARAASASGPQFGSAEQEEAEVGKFVAARVWPLAGAAGQSVHALSSRDGRILINGKVAEAFREPQAREGYVQETFVHPDDPSLLVHLYHSPSSLEGFEKRNGKLERLTPLAAAGAAPKLLEHGEASVAEKGMHYFYVQEMVRGSKLAELAPASRPMDAVRELFARLEKTGLALTVPGPDPAWLLSHIMIGRAPDGVSRAYLLDGALKPMKAEDLAAHYGMLLSILNPSPAGSVRAAAERPEAGAAASAAAATTPVLPGDRAELFKRVLSLNRAAPRTKERVGVFEDADAVDNLRIAGDRLGMLAKLRSIDTWDKGSRGQEYLRRVFNEAVENRYGRESLGILKALLPWTKTFGSALGDQEASAMIEALGSGDSDKAEIAALTLDGLVVPKTETHDAAIKAKLASLPAARAIELLKAFTHPRFQKYRYQFVLQALNAQTQSWDRLLAVLKSPEIFEGEGFNPLRARVLELFSAAPSSVLDRIGLEPDGPARSASEPARAEPLRQDSRIPELLNALRYPATAPSAFHALMAGDALDQAKDRLTRENIDALYGAISNWLRDDAHGAMVRAVFAAFIAKRPDLANALDAGVLAGYVDLTFARDALTELLRARPELAPGILKTLASRREFQRDRRDRGGFFSPFFGSGFLGFMRGFATIPGVIMMLCNVDGGGSGSRWGFAVGAALALPGLLARLNIFGRLQRWRKEAPNRQVVSEVFKSADGSLMTPDLLQQVATIEVGRPKDGKIEMTYKPKPGYGWLARLISRRLPKL